MASSTCRAKCGRDAEHGGLLRIPWGSGLEEGEQVGVDLVLMRGGNAVRRAGIVDVFGAIDQPGRLDGGILDRNDLVLAGI